MNTKTNLNAMPDVEGPTVSMRLLYTLINVRRTGIKYSLQVPYSLKYGSLVDMFHNFQPQN